MFISFFTVFIGTAVTVAAAVEVALLLSVEAADKCGDRCTSTQVCGHDGACLDKSSLVECGSWFFSWYCLKDQGCCGYETCMPGGAVCCGSYFYCDRGRKCCGTSDCCEAGYFCDKRKCVLDKKYKHFRWWYGVIIGAAVVTVAIIFAAVLWNRRNSRSNAPGQSGTDRIVFSAPPQIHGTGICGGGIAFSAPPQIQGTGTCGGGMMLTAHVQTNGQSPTQNMHTMAKNTGVPMHTN